MSRELTLRLSDWVGEQIAAVAQRRGIEPGEWIAEAIKESLELEAADARVASQKKRPAQPEPQQLSSFRDDRHKRMKLG